MAFKNPKIGALRHRVEIHRPRETPDGGGGCVVVWEKSAGYWAAIETASAGEEPVAAGLREVITHRITFRAGVAAPLGARIVFQNRTFRIKARYEPNEAGRWLVCLCSEELT